MHKLFHFILFTLTLFLTPLTSLHSEIIQYENLVIEKIDIQIVNLPPNAHFNENLLRSKMKTSVGDLFSQNTFDNDLKTLAKDYDRVEPQIEIVGNKLYITLKIWFKPQIRTIQWNGNRAFRSDELQKELGLNPGVIYDRLSFNKAFNKLKAYYVKKGYFEAELDYEIVYDKCTNDVDILIGIKEGRCGKIKKIIYHNFTNCEIEDIEGLMVTKEYKFFFSWFNDEGIYNSDAIQHDEFTILTYLQNEGYADAKVKIEVVEYSHDRIVIHITADKGPIYNLGEITFEGNTLFTTDDIRSQLQIGPGCRYSPEKLREAMLKIVDLYGKYGYIDAITDFEPILDPDCPVYSIRFTIDEGEQFRVGMIKIFGNCTTSNPVILHECLLIPGEVFNILKLKRTEERLQNIGYFKCVNVYAVRSEDSVLSESNYRDVHIELEETNTGHLSGFGGFSNLENIFGGISITEKNFNHNGLGLIFKEGYRALRGGGEYAYFNVTIGSKSQAYTFSWAKPYFRDTQWIVGFDIEKNSVRYISSDYTLNSLGLTLHAKYPLNDYMRLGMHYRIKNNNVHVGKIADKNQAIQETARNKGIVDALGFAFAYDSTDSPRKPSCGFRSRIEAEFAGIGGRYKFLAFGYLNTWYYSISKKEIFKIRIDNKYVIPIFNTHYNNMPLGELLFLGGDDTVRGYRPYSLGPTFPGTNDPRGGLSLNLFTAEYCYSFWKNVDLFAYLDAGSLTEGKTSFGPLKAAVGFGVRFTIMEGMPPIAIGVGFPIKPTNKADIQRIFFSLGASF